MRKYSNEEKRVLKLFFEIWRAFRAVDSNRLAFGTLALPQSGARPSDLLQKWNSFTTNFLRPCEEVVGFLRILDVGRKNGELHMHVLLVMRIMVLPVPVNGEAQVGIPLPAFQKFLDRYFAAARRYGFAAQKDLQPCYGTGQGLAQYLAEKFDCPAPGIKSFFQQTRRIGKSRGFSHVVGNYNRLGGGLGINPRYKWRKTQQKGQGAGFKVPRSMPPNLFP